MNTRESDILQTILLKGFVNQRILSDDSGYSLGMVNRSLHELNRNGYIDADCRPTDLAASLLKDRAPRNAVILAAGFGMRMVPINLSTPKALLEVRGEVLIERMIRQLHAAGVTDITVIVGFMKERFEYLIDEYGVELVVNPDYSRKNNLSSLALVADRLGNTYIIPSDIWTNSNPFSNCEMYSWYMVSDDTDSDSTVRVNRRKELVKVSENTNGNRMIGISYLLEKDAADIVGRIKKYASDPAFADEFWECALYKGDRMDLPAKVVSSDEAVEINTFEQLREFDRMSNHLHSDALDVIAKVFSTSPDQITDIQVLKKGMTNRSFLFAVKGNKYIMRIPGEGTDQLIDRAQEAEVYRTISGHGLCDDPIYIDPSNGYKITKFLDGVRVCDTDDMNDLERCMAKLRQFHEMKLSVSHSFDLFGQIDFYEKLRKGNPSIYKDYALTKEHVMSLKSFIERERKDWCLTHIDAVPDNFLFYRCDDGEELQLTDWEYSGMQDPHVDIAMFCIYSLFNKDQVDQLIDIYFRGECSKSERTKIYAYIAVCGLLWSNWCEFKSLYGVEFGEYSLRQYRYAKDYYQFAVELMGSDTNRE